jgi:hypothetical protein
VKINELLFAMRFAAYCCAENAAMFFFKPLNGTEVCQIAE